MVFLVSCHPAPVATSISRLKRPAPSLPNDTGQRIREVMFECATQAAPATEASLRRRRPAGLWPWRSARLGLSRGNQYDRVAARDGPFSVAAGEQDVDLQGRGCAVYACCSRFEQAVHGVAFSRLCWSCSVALEEQRPDLLLAAC